jgi:hypothetical protein
MNDGMSKQLAEIRISCPLEHAGNPVSEPRGREAAIDVDVRAGQSKKFLKVGRRHWWNLPNQSDVTFWGHCSG